MLSGEPRLFPVFFFNDTATTEIYTLSLHDALPISPTIEAPAKHPQAKPPVADPPAESAAAAASHSKPDRSEEHTSELQSHLNLVCRLLLEKKKKTSSGNSRSTAPAASTISKRQLAA